WMKVQTDFHSVNLSTGEKTRSIVGDGERRDEVVGPAPSEPQASEPQVQVSGPQCVKCGAFTTYARVRSHGLCMKCENATPEVAKPQASPRCTCGHLVTGHYGPGN